MWIAYRLLSDDLEMACDERTADWFEEREDYLKVLVSSSGKAYPVLPSFAYGNIRNRVSHLLSYDLQRNTVTAVFAVVLTLILAAVPLLGYRYSTVVLKDHGMSLHGPVEHSELVCGFEEYPDHHEADYINKIDKNGKVYPLMDGIVEFVGFDEVYGHYVCISHDSGYRSYYCYLSDVSVKEGDSVSSSPIGTIGDSGRATGEHVGVAMTDEKGNYVRNLENILFRK